MDHFELSTAWRSDPGLVRQNNEDAVAEDPSIGLLLLADGMGGHNAGEIASRLAVDTAYDRVRQSCSNDSYGPVGRDLLGCLRSAFSAAHGVIKQEAEANASYAGMGTTLVACLIEGSRVGFASVGDSRIYRLRGDALTQLTRDHSLVEELVARGLYDRDEARRIVNRNIVTRALGIDPVVAVDVFEDEMQEGDVLLLCSDGLTDMVEDSLIRATLLLFANDLPRAAEKLVAAAKESGGEDNVTVLLARARKITPERRWYQRILG